MSDRAQAVAQSLTEWGRREVAPVRVTIDGTSYEGARYADTPDRYIYLVGELPESEQRLYYRFPNDDGDWYVAGHMRCDRISSENEQFHPPVRGSSCRVGLTRRSMSESMTATTRRSGLARTSRLRS